MNYEKKYNEALAKARTFYKKWDGVDAYNSSLAISELKEIFPELKESGEEKLRKEMLQIAKESEDSFYMVLTPKKRETLIAWLENQDFNYTFEIKEGHWYKCVCDYMLNNSDVMFKYDRLYYCRRDWRLDGEIDEINVKDIGVNGYKSFFRPATNQEIKDWLEKQGEQKPFNYESANIQQKDFAPKVESKFRKGDFIKHNRVNIICKVILVNSVSYYVENIETRVESELFYAEENFHLWTIEDIKDGNVLYSPEHNLLWIYKNKDTYHVATNLNYPHDISIDGDIVIPSDVCPASKEQCDILLARLKKYGYTWDKDTKQLIKLYD